MGDGRVCLRGSVRREALAAWAASRGLRRVRDVLRGESNHGVVRWEDEEGARVTALEDAMLCVCTIEGSESALASVRESFEVWTAEACVERVRAHDVRATLASAAVFGADSPDETLVDALTGALGAPGAGVRRAALVAIEELGWAEFDAALAARVGDPVWGDLVARLLEARGGSA